MAATPVARIARRIVPAVPQADPPAPVRFEVADLLARIEAAMDRRPA